MHFDSASYNRKYITLLEGAFNSFNSAYGNKSETADPFGLVTHARAEYVHYVLTLKFMDDYIQHHANPACLDLGGHLGILSSVFARLGFEAFNVDNSVHFEAGLWQAASAYMSKNKVKFLDADMMNDGFRLPLDDAGIHIAVFQAVIEHLPHSPRPIFREVNRVLRKDGAFIVCTPNGGHVGCRLKMFRKGDWPYWDLRKFYESTVPFLGHHRLYSNNDLDKMAQWSGFSRDAKNTIFYEPPQEPTGSLKWRIFRKFVYQPFICRLFPEWRHGIWAVYRKIKTPLDE